MLGVRIGDGCVIGSGAVVTKDIPAYSAARGVPTKVLRPHKLIMNTIFDYLTQQVVQRGMID